MTTNQDTSLGPPSPLTGQAATPVTTTSRLVGWLVGFYLVLTWATAVAAVAMAASGSSAIGQEASVHAAILAVVSILTLVFTVNLMRGKPRANVRLRIIAIILAAALIVTAIVLPMPVWMITGHAVGAALLLATLLVLCRRPAP